LIKSDIPSYINVIVSTVNNSACGISEVIASQNIYYMCFVGPQRFEYTPSLRIVDALQNIAVKAPSESSLPVIVGAIIGGAIIVSGSILLAYLFRRTSPVISSAKLAVEEKRLVVMNPLNSLKESPAVLPPVYIIPPPPPVVSHILPVNRSRRSLSDISKGTFKPLGISEIVTRPTSISISANIPLSDPLPKTNRVEISTERKPFHELLSGRWLKPEPIPEKPQKAELVRRVSIAEFKPQTTRKGLNNNDVNTNTKWTN